MRLLLTLLSLSALSVRDSLQQRVRMDETLAVSVANRDGKWEVRSEEKQAKLL